MIERHIFPIFHNEVQELSWVPGVDTVFMVTWKSIKDRSYTTDLWRVVAGNEVSVLGERLHATPTQRIDRVIFRFDDVKFHPVPQGFVDAYLNKEQSDD